MGTWRDRSTGLELDDRDRPCVRGHAPYAVGKLLPRQTNCLAKPMPRGLPPVKRVEPMERPHPAHLWHGEGLPTHLQARPAQGPGAQDSVSQAGRLL